MNNSMMWPWLRIGASGTLLGVFRPWRFSMRPRVVRWTIGSIVENLEQRLVLTPTSEEQLFVYLLNKIRHDPQAYDVEAGLGGILDGVEVRQPLAVNADLFDSARFHAVEMADHNYFAHQSAITGDWPNKMARDQGYDLPHFFTSNNNFIESLAAGNVFSAPADVLKLLIVDAGVPSLGHRNHLLGIDSFNAEATEIGVGHGFNLSSLYDHYWAAHITHSETEGTFLTGVVFQDANNNQAFGLSEGLSGVTVSIAGQALSTQTNSAGGWSIRVPGPGSYTAQAAGGGFVGTATAVVQVGVNNREVDFISGSPSGTIDFGTVPPGANLPPVNTLPLGPLTPLEDVLFPIQGLSIDDSDAANASVTVTLVVAQGKLNIATDVVGGLNASQVTGNHSAQIVLTGPLSKINTTLADVQGLSYQADLNFNGLDTFSVLTNDGGNTGSGGPQADFDIIEFEIVPTNDAPVNTVPLGTVSTVTSIPLNVTGLSFLDVDLGLQNAQVTLGALHGIVTLRDDIGGGLTPADITNNGTSFVTITAPSSRIVTTFATVGGLRYLSDNGYIGPDNITMNTSDQGQTGVGPVGIDQDTIAVQVQAVPIAPVVTIPASTVTSNKGRLVIVGVGANITDADSPTFLSGRLNVLISSGAQPTDRLTVHTVGRQPGQINLKSNQLRLGKSVIGNVAGGTNGSPLRIQFTSNVSIATVENVLQNISLKASRGRLLSGIRVISVSATDPTQLTSVPVSRPVNVP